jgi:WXXGXW repeat (2 copies)
MRTLLLATAAVIGLSAVAIAQPAPPPALRYEAVPPPPAGGAMIWRPGTWRWYGNRYVWVGGGYIARPAVYGRWVPGHWGPGGPGGWHWVEAHWE